jgi:hypothetical protein
VRLGKVAVDETAVTVRVESRAANNGVGWKIEAWSVIVATREGSLDTTVRTMLKRSTVSAVIHDVEVEINKLQLVQERHSAVKQVQVVKSESLDFIPAEFVDMKFDKTSPSPPNPLNQHMRVELKRCALFHDFVIDPVDDLCIFDDSGQRVVWRVANVLWCL